MRYNIFCHTLALEYLSYLCFQMAQENQNSSISKLSSSHNRSGFKKIMAFVGAMTFSTLTAQTTQPISNNVGTQQVAKSPIDSIKNKAEYNAEYQKLVERWEKLNKEEKAIDAHHALRKEQSDMLMWSVKFLNRIQSQNGVVTEADVRMAKWSLRVIANTQRLPELQWLVLSAKRIYEYLASQTTQAFTRN